MSVSPGLYVLGTPIGNLGDISRRCVETLAASELVIAEDTRRTRQLLSHLGLTGKQLVRLDANASPREIEQVAQSLVGGKVAALVTDAGMPAVSDPGGALVTRCRQLEVFVCVVPGPSAVTCAVAASGFEGGFWFAGFLPRKGEKRRDRLRQIVEFEEMVVMFEAANRMQATLNDLAELMPERGLCVARELTKQFEQVTVRSVERWLTEPQQWLGEVTLVLGPVVDAARDATSLAEDVDALIQRRLQRGETARAVADALAPLLRVSRRAIYQRALEL